MTRDIRLSVAIMTHPARVERAQSLADSISDLNPALVVEMVDSSPGNLGNALRAWSLVGAQATHHMVLQDDVVPCEGFSALLHAAVSARPSEAISLFCEWGSRSAGLVRAAARQGWGWARAVDMYTPTQGLVLPREAALLFASQNDIGGADDLALVEFLRQQGIENLITVPNLVEHDDRQTLVQNGFQGLRHAVCLPIPGLTPDFGTPVAGTALTRLPYASWMRTHAEWFYCGTRPSAYTWIGDFADTRLPPDLQKANLVEQFRCIIDRANPHLVATVNELALFEYWTVYFALGLVETTPTPSALGPYAEGAFNTAFPGLFRRHLPTATTDALSGDAGRLAMTAYALGAEAELQRPHSDWFEEPIL